MGRRTLTAWQLSFHEKFVREAATFAPSDLNGEDLIDLFQSWVSSLSADETKDENRQSWISVTRVDRFAPRVLLVELSVGSYGEAGPVVEADTGREVFVITETQAPTGRVRCVLMVPETGLSAFYLAEQSSRGSAGSRLMALFRRHFSRHSRTVTMQTETVSESEAWSSDAALKEVEVRLKGMSADIADGPQVEVGTLSYVARAGRGRVFPRRLMTKLGTNHTVAGQVVGVPVAEEAEVYVTMELDGRQKKFLLGGRGAPNLRQVLNDSAEPPLPDSGLVQVCVDRVSDLAARTGGSWNDAWSTP